MWFLPKLPIYVTVSWGNSTVQRSNILVGVRLPLLKLSSAIYCVSLGELLNLSLYRCEKWGWEYFLPPKQRIALRIKWVDAHKTSSDWQVVNSHLGLFLVFFFSFKGPCQLYWWHHKSWIIKEDNAFVLKQQEPLLMLFLFCGC